MNGDHAAATTPDTIRIIILSGHKPAICPVSAFRARLLASKVRKGDPDGMKLNKRQQIAVWAGLGIVALMGLGYPYLASHYQHIEVTQLLVQWVVVAAVTGGAVLALKDRGDGGDT